MINNTDSERTIQCPYDKSHQIINYRFQRHLTRCRRNFETSKTVVCTFNITHVVPEPELNYHMENCPDRVAIDKFMFAPEQTISTAPPLQKVNISSHENWDDDCNHPTYDALEKSKTKAVIRSSNQTLSAAQRRKFRSDERERMNNLALNNHMLYKESGEAQKDYEAPLRRPHPQSSGIQDNNDTDDLLKQIKKDANIVSTPRMGPNIIHSAKLDYAGAVPTAEPTSNVDSLKDFPPLGGIRKDPRDSVWNASSIAETFKPASRGRGRNLQK